MMFFWEIYEFFRTVIEHRRAAASALSSNNLLTGYEQLRY